MIASWQESYDKPRQFVEKQRHYSVDKAPYIQGYGLPSGHVWLWELDYKEGRVPNNWCLWAVVLEKTPESPLDSQIKPVNHKRNKPWILIERTDAEAEVQAFWSYDVNSWLIDWGQKKRVSEDEMAWWHQQFNGPELGQTLGDGEWQGGLECYSSWGSKELDMTEWLNNNTLHRSYISRVTI